MERITTIRVEQLVGQLALSPVRKTTLLAGEQLQHFQSLCRQMLAYWPSQEFAPETLNNFLLELERLAVNHGLSRLEKAFLAFRQKPGQRWFPHPNEVL